MSSISDLVEQFILSMLGEESSVVISRNRLAQKFDCAPSQITYVLKARFTAERGFVTVSRRGGGGHIELMRVSGNEPFLNNLILGGIGGELTLTRAMHITERMFNEGVIDGKEYNIISAVIGDGAIPPNYPDKDILRAQIFKALVEALIKE